MENRKATKDLWFASFLKLRGYEVVDFDVEKDRRRGTFYFNIDDDTWKHLKLDFDKTDLSKIKYLQGQLKDLLY